MIEVVRGGLLTTVQDHGRCGFLHLGVSRGGAADPFALRVANLLVGNPADSAVLEMALAGPTLRFTHEALVAWCGADFQPTYDGAPLPGHRPVVIPAGSVLAFPAARRGAMAWLAIAGGIDVPVIMESRATDLKGGFGGFEGRKLVDGDVLSTTQASAQQSALSSKYQAQPPAWSLDPARLGDSVHELRIIPGPEWAWFSETAKRDLFTHVYQVSKDSNRMGARLSGPPLALEAPHEMASSAVLPGTVQVPPSGQPILLGADCQTLGGYPRIGALATVDQGKLAQLRPAETLRFREISVSEARALLLERERHLAMAVARLSLL